jgi:hypothetical protein
VSGWGHDEVPGLSRAGSIVLASVLALPLVIGILGIIAQHRAW